ncbi:MAG: AAA family ATPase [Deltaproteobacteria bacterium]|nr:AAA family ATPase [Deltaproteobacteria bacterium]
MYLNYYELKSYPFRTNPDPGFLWFGEKHKEALSLLKYGILKRDGFLLLTGDVGTGKTSLVRYLLRIIDSSALVAIIQDANMPAIDLFNYLSEEFKMNSVFTSKAHFLIQFKKFLLRAYSEHKSIFIIIDEAQRLNHERLEEIRLLSNIELDDQKLINIFFIGQSEIEKILMDESNRAISQRINLSYHIQPLDELETAHYIAHRLKIAGAKRGIFTVSACREIFAISGGIPRLINSICDCALLSGFTKDRKVVDMKLINECQIDLRIPIETTRKHKHAATDP